MKFEIGKKYTDRLGREYTFIRKGSGSVIWFEDSSGKLKARNESGAYRWDNKQTDEDIVG